MGLLEGKVALISGAGRGQGRSHAIRLAKEGADIIGIDVPTSMPTVGYPMSTAQELRETARLVEAEGRRMVTYECDVRDGTGMTQVIDAGAAEFGRIDIVLANAGVGSFSPAETMTDAVWDEMIAVNLSGVFRTIRPAIPHLKRHGDGGSIVLTGSVAGMKGIRNLVHYTAAKHGLVGMTKALAVELAPFGIRVNIIHPTNVDTPLIHNEPTYALFMPDRDPSTVTRDDVAPIFAGAQLIDIPWLEPNDVSEAILFLVGPGARYITGASLPIDAGNTLK